MQAEQKRRERFYEEMSEQQKAEFINGEVIVQSPARLRHTLQSIVVDGFSAAVSAIFAGAERFAGNSPEH